MGLFDVDGFGSSEKDTPIKAKPQEEVFHENSFDRSIVDKINPLIKVEVINKRYNLKKLLLDLGYDMTGANMYCPFHPDEATGKPSAKYHEDTDLLYCFSENKMYSAYHAIKLLYGLNIDKVFKDIWINMPLEERHELMDKYEEGNQELVAIPSTWEKYRKLVLDKFRTHEVSYKQYKNALFKVLKIVSDEDENTQKGTT